MAIGTLRQFFLVALVALVALVLAAAPAFAQGRVQAPSTDLLSAPEVQAAVTASAKGGPMSHFDGALQRVHVAYERHLADRAAGLVSATFAERVQRSFVRGEAIIIDAIAPSEAEVVALGEDLKALGFVETGRYRHIISGYLPLGAIREAAGLPTLRAASTAQATTGRLSEAALGEIRARRVGAVEGEASLALRADKARSLFGVDGSGLIIGVLSDSYDNCAALNADADPLNDCLTSATDDVTSGDLPAGVVVLDDLDAVNTIGPFPGIDEGRAMIQLAFDVAPGADFAFHTAFEGTASFASGIQDLITAGADVVVDDISYFAQPAFQDDIIAQSAQTAFDSGVPYFSSAGNNADAAYDGTFTASATTIMGAPVHDFDPGAGDDPFQDIVVPDGGTVTLSVHWDEPSGLAGSGQAPSSDYDVAFFDSPSTGGVILASSIDNNAATTLPNEIISYTNSTGLDQTVYFLITKFSGPATTPQLAYISFGSNGDEVSAAEYNGGATINGHSKAAGTFSTAAGAWFDAPANGTGLLEAEAESFTSYGGRAIRLSSTGVSLGVPEDRMKPNAMASDADNNTFFGQQIGDGDTNPNFFGTSAAAPNAAAVAALMIEAAGGAGSVTPAEVYAALEGTAEDLANADGTNPDTAAGHDDRTGVGFIRADRAVASVAATPLAVLINEIDIDQTGTDDAEFVELLGTPGVALDGLVLVAINGADDEFYQVVDLDGLALDGAGLHVTCGDAANVANCDLDVSPNTNLIQNDAEAMVLALGQAFDYNDGRLLIPTQADIVDVLLHASGGNVADSPDAGLLAALGDGITYDEDLTSNATTESLGRLNGVAYTGSASSLFYPLAPSPGVANAETFTVAQTDIADLAGFRLLASPMAETRTAGGVDVTDVVGGTAVGQLAAVDMVQGVAAGITFPAEYAGADDVLFNSFGGDTNYGSPATTDDVLVPGLGFFWYWFDTDFGPVAGGTSQSHDLATIDVSLGGIPHEADLTTPTIPETTDGFYMLGNPFPYPLGLDGIGTTAMGTLSTSFQVYDPDGNTFGVRTTAEDVAALQGVFAQIIAGGGSGGGAGTPAFTFDASAIDADLRTPDGDFAGLEAVEGRLSLRLDGLSTTGVRLADGAAILRLLAEGTEAWDRHDMSKLSPPGERALIAPVGIRDDASHRQAVMSLPDGFEGEVPLAFETTLDGQFTLTWTLKDLDADVSVRLTDLVTGTVVDLQSAEGYAFSTDAVEWGDRFVLTLGDDLGTAVEDGETGAFVGLLSPNPTAGTARLALRVAEAGPVRVTVLDVLGREVAVVHDGALAAGAERRLSLDTGSLAPGAYFVRITGPGLAETRRLSVVR